MTVKKTGNKKEGGLGRLFFFQQLDSTVHAQRQRERRLVQLRTLFPVVRI